MPTLETIAERHNVPVDAAKHLLDALARGDGRMAQFNHPALGGMGQWHAGGMTMIGDMFNDGLKARVSALCNDLVPLVAEHRTSASGRSAGWWPADLGQPSTTGSQNSTRYAYFPEARRLAIESDGRVRIYDTAEHHIGGVSQQQGSGTDLAFSSQLGAVRLHDLRELSATSEAHDAPKPMASPRPAAPPADAHGAANTGDDPLKVLDRLAELHKKGVLTDAEFATKKAELLSRL